MSRRPRRNHTPVSAGEPGSSPWTASRFYIGSLGNGFFTHWSLASCFLRHGLRNPTIRYPGGTGKAMIFRSKPANSRRVRWLSASKSQ